MRQTKSIVCDITKEVMEQIVFCRIQHSNAARISRSAVSWLLVGFYPALAKETNSEVHALNKDPTLQSQFRKALPLCIGECPQP